MRCPGSNEQVWEAINAVCAGIPIEQGEEREKGCRLISEIIPMFCLVVAIVRGSVECVPR